MILLLSLLNSLFCSAFICLCQNVSTLQISPLSVLLQGSSGQPFWYPYCQDQPLIALAARQKNKKKKKQKQNQKNFLGRTGPKCPENCAVVLLHLLQLCLLLQCCSVGVFTHLVLSVTLLATTALQRCVTAVPRRHVFCLCFLSSILAEH